MAHTSFKLAVASAWAHYRTSSQQLIGHMLQMRQSSQLNCLSQKQVGFDKLAFSQIVTLSYSPVHDAQSR